MTAVAAGDAPRVPRERAERAPADAEQQQSPEGKSKAEVRRQFQVQKPVESKIRWDKQSRQGQGKTRDPQGRNWSKSGKQTDYRLLGRLFPAGKGKLIILKR